MIVMWFQQNCDRIIFIAFIVVKGRLNTRNSVVSLVCKMKPCRPLKVATKLLRAKTERILLQ